MIARDLISNAFPPVRTSDSAQKVLDRMAEFRVNHLPIVNDLQLLGLVSDEDLIEIMDYTTPIGSLALSCHNAFINEEQHVYDVIRLFVEMKISVVPVLDSRSNYLGLISINGMMEHIAMLTSVKHPGSILVLELDRRSNSLMHIAQIVESENAQILSSYVHQFQDSTKLEVTLKLNKTDIAAIITSFIRHNYTVKASYNTKRPTEGNALGRYDQLMNYLSI